MTDPIDPMTPRRAPGSYMTGVTVVTARTRGIALPGDTGPRSAPEAHLAGRGPTFSLGPACSVYDDGRHGASTAFSRGRARTPDTGGAGRFVPIDALGELRIADGAEATMLRRCRFEHAHRDFGFHLGTRRSGEVHRTSDEED